SRLAARRRPLPPIARCSGWRTLRACAHEVRRIDSQAKSAGPIEVAAAPADPSAFGRAAEALRGSVPQEIRPLAEELIEHVRAAPDAAVSRIRPFELADFWLVPRLQVLALCLRAVMAGLLELSWDLV